MFDVNMTIVPEALDDPDASLHDHDPLGLPALGDPSDESTDPLAAPRPRTSLSDAVDGFIDEHTDSEDLPRLPVATTDETLFPSLSLSLEGEAPPPAPASPPPRGLSSPVGLLLGGMGLVGVGLLMATAAVGAGVGAVVWWGLSTGAVPAMADTVEPVEAAAVVEAMGTDDGDVMPAEAEHEAADAEVDEGQADDEAAAPVAADPVPVPPTAAPPRAAAPPPPVAAPDAPKRPVVAAPVAPSDTPEPEAAPETPVPEGVPAGTDDGAPTHTVKLLSSPPAARILIDGQDRGRTPLKLELTEGDHTVVLETGGVRTTVPVNTIGVDRLCFSADQGVFATSDCP